MTKFRLVFLLSVLLVASGYKFRCWWACQDQTAIQNDYVEQRDRCRQYAQLKLDMGALGGGAGDKSRKERLVELFSDCMGNNGWNTTDIKGTKSPTAGQPPFAPDRSKEEAAIAASVAAAEERAAISRASECAFARQAASVSSMAAARARACDLECTNRLRAAPDAPRPAACPAGSTPGLSSGYERVNE